MKPFINEMMNATGLAFDPQGMLYISSRYDGIVYQVTPNGNMSVYVEGMGVATGIAFDHEDNLYVGDRSGTIFKISPSRQIFVFATLEPSIAAYHLAFGPDGYLYVTGPTTSSFDSVYRISHAGEVEIFYRGLGRPQGMAFDEEGALYVAASIAGRRGVVRIYPDKRADLFLSGPGIVGLAFTPSRAMIVATTNAIYRVDVGIKGFANALMNAEIIAVGSEMLTPQRVDTNSLYLTGELNNLGVEVVTKCCDRRRPRTPGRRRAPRPFAFRDRDLVAAVWDLPKTTSRAKPWRRRSTASWSFIPRSHRRWSSASRA